MQDLYGIFRATPPTLTDGQQAQLAVNSRGGLITDIGTIAADAEYETVAASQTDQILGATGAVGDYLTGLLIVPATTGAGTVSIKDGNGTGINVFVSGTLADLKPIWVPLGIKAVNATTPGWKVTTGANVSVIGIGNFT